MERCKLFPAITIAVVFFFACDNKQGTRPNEKILGKWYYVDFPDSYIEIGETAYTEYIGGTEPTIVYNVSWKDSLHFQLKVKRTIGLKSNLKPGDKIQIEIKDLTPDYYRFYLQYNNQSQCIVVVRKKDYKGPTGTPCQHQQ